jgi:hypothetical protein
MKDRLITKLVLVFSDRVSAIALGFGVIAAIVLMFIDQYLIAAGVLIGLFLGAVNYRLMELKVDDYVNKKIEASKVQVGLYSLMRLMAITVLAIGAFFLSHKLAYGIMGGVCVFQLVFLGYLARLIASEAMKLKGEI